MADGLVVFQDPAGDGFRSFDIGSETLSPLLATGYVGSPDPRQLGLPSIDAGRFAFMAFDGNDYELYLADIGSGVVSAITGDSQDDFEPDLSGSRVAMRSGGYREPGPSDLVLMEIGQANGVVLANDVGDISLYGDWIAWDSVSPIGDSVVRLVNLVTGDQFDLGPGDDPDVGSEFVVWSRGTRLCGRSLVSGAWACEESGAGAVANPRVDGGGAAYTRFSGTGGFDAMYTDLQAFVVPEPSTAVLLFFGLIALQRRHRVGAEAG